MNLVIKSFIVALLAVSNVNAANIRGTRQAPANEAEGHASFVAIGSSSDGCRVNRDCPSQHICQFRGREDRGTCVRRNNSSSSLPTSYSSSSSDDTNTCRVNRDCPSRHICQFRGREARGTCVRRNASSSSDDTQTCRRNNDCPDPDTQRCNDAGYCVIRDRMVPRSGDMCTRNGDCSSNRICGDNGHCQRRDMEFAMEQY